MSPRTTFAAATVCSVSETSAARASRRAQADVDPTTTPTAHTITRQYVLVIETPHNRTKLVERKIARTAVREGAASSSGFEALLRDRSRAVSPRTGIGCLRRQNLDCVDDNRTSRWRSTPCTCRGGDM